jgi:hypothetical protein
MTLWADTYKIALDKDSFSVNIWKRDGRIVVPPDLILKHEILKITHNNPTAGHPGRDETLRLTEEGYWWPFMNSWIKDYVAGCATCQQNKNIMHRPRAPLYRILSDSTALPFQQVAMDLIVALPPNGAIDSILTIVDHGCSRAALFLPCNQTIMGPGIAQLYLDNVYRWFGLPRKVISDRDTRFTSHFGRALAKKLGVDQHMSTAYHPQTDGLAEQKNQWIEQYLHLVTSAQPEDWSQWLTIATAVHNDRINSTTGMTPNEALLGYRPLLYPNQVIPSNNDGAEL